MPVAKRPLIIDVDDPQFVGGEKLGTLDYETLLAEGDPEFGLAAPGNEWQAITLNYTSGTTGNPKGVVYHHRGAYLNAPATPAGTWACIRSICGPCRCSIAMAGASRGPSPPRSGSPVSACARCDPDLVFDLIKREKVNHFCGAPIVLELAQQRPG